MLFLFWYTSFRLILSVWDVKVWICAVQFLQRWTWRLWCFAGAHIRTDTHTNINIEACPQDNWPAVTQEGDRQKCVIMLHSHLQKLIQIRAKIFSQYVCMSVPGALIVLQPMLDFERWWVNVHMQIPNENQHEYRRKTHWNIKKKMTDVSNF